MYVYIYIYIYVCVWYPPRLIYQFWCKSCVFCPRPLPSLISSFKDCSVYVYVYTLNLVRVQYQNNTTDTRLHSIFMVILKVPIGALFLV